MNALVHVSFTVDVPEERLEHLVGRPDDGSDAWNQEACEKAEEWVDQNLSDALDHVTGDFTVEAM